MPIYRFELEVRLTTQAAMARINELVRPPLSYGEEIKRRFRSADVAGPPFVGTVDEGTFRVRRAIRYRNSFLPLVWGRVTSVPTGSQISVTMHLHPLVAVFMSLWIIGTGTGALAVLNVPSGNGQSAALMLMGMFVFGILLVCGGFFPEAVKARRLLEQAFAVTGA